MSRARLDSGRASLPMYDWTELRRATDALWAGVRDALRAGGFAAPEALDRRADASALWTAWDLVLSQTCGLPYVRHLRGRVALVGTPDYGLPDCPSGWYRSVVVARRDDPREAVEEFRGARLALNGADSQSGAQAMMFHLGDRSGPGPFFGVVLASGSHERSARMVAEDAADLAAIDAVTWRLIEAHRTFAGALRIVARTAPTPGLPLITAGDPERVAAAFEAAVAGLDPGAREVLGLRGLVRTRDDDYDLIAERDAAMRAVSAAHGL